MHQVNNALHYRGFLIGRASLSFLCDIEYCVTVYSDKLIWPFLLVVTGTIQ